MRLAIFGTGGMGRELFDIAIGAAPDIVFVTDAPDGPVCGVPVIAPDQLLPTDQLSLALGSSAHRRTLAKRFSGHPFATMIARTAIVSPSAQIGEGAVLCEHVVVNNSAQIGVHFQANVFAQVSHDCIIGDYVTLSPRVSINGWVEIEDDVFVGAGAVIRNGSPERRLKVGRGATIAMGAVVIGDVEEGVTVMGVPAKPRRA